MTLILNPDTKKYPVVKCVFCGRSEQVVYNAGVVADLVARSSCHNCNWWEDTSESVQQQRTVRPWPNAIALLVPGTGICTAFVGDEGAPSGAFRGYGGSKYLILFFDGREMVSTNMWSITKIPKLREYDPRLSPSARLVTAAEIGGEEWDARCSNAALARNFYLGPRGGI